MERFFLSWDKTSFWFRPMTKSIMDLIWMGFIVHKRNQMTYSAPFFILYYLKCPQRYLTFVWGVKTQIKKHFYITAAGKFKSLKQSSAQTHTHTQSLFSIQQTCTNVHSFSWRRTGAERHREEHNVFKMCCQLAAEDQWNDAMKETEWSKHVCCFNEVSNVDPELMVQVKVIQTLPSLIKSF